MKPVVPHFAKAMPWSTVRKQINVVGVLGRLEGGSSRVKGTPNPPPPPAACTSSIRSIHVWAASG